MIPRLRQLVLRFAIVLGTTCCLLALVPPFLRTGKTAYAATDTLHLDHPDAVCRNCHQQIYDRYAQTPMARGSGLAIEGLDATQLAAKDLVHESSGVTYHVSVTNGQPSLSYSRPATAVRGALDGSYRLEYFVGSGHRGRTYLYNQQGLWFEAPINWYGKKQVWDMAPAFDTVRSMPAPLPVDPNCLHCHAGEVQPAVGPARNRYDTQPFRSGGVGCAACHGDPAAHLKQVTTPAVSRREMSSTEKANSGILDPSRLEPSRRDSICLQCHLEGDASVYLPGKSLQAFQPAEKLSDSVTYFIDKNRAELGLRASSQYEALLRSACKRGAGDRLTCTTCHDPHGSPKPAERVAFFRSRCVACHADEAISVRHHPEQQDCAVCHMPTRNTLDISHEQLTDHNIQAIPDKASLSKGLSAMRRAADLVPVGGGHAGDRELGLAYAQLAQRGDRAAGERALVLLRAAEQAGSHDAELQDQLGFLLQISGSPAAAAERYRSALKQSPTDITALANLAVIDAASGLSAEAMRLLGEVVQDDPAQTAAGLNLAFLECRAGKKQEALGIVERMLQYNPDSRAAQQLLQTGRYGDQHCALR